jgi:hypothetical protein
MTRWPVLDLQWAIPLWLTILSGAAVVLIGAASYMLIVYPTIVKGQSTKGKE